MINRLQEYGEKLGGVVRSAAVLFTDIRSYSTVVSQSAPQILVTQLNEYFTAMVQCVFECNGTLDKFIGDALMAVWGAPIAQSDDAQRAIQAALDMQATLDSFNAFRRDRGDEAIEIGIGLASGRSVSGAIGARRRMEYTVIGDTANVASRLTSADIARRDQVACSAETLSELGNDVDSVDLGAILVKGRAEPVACYQINRLGALANPNAAPAPQIRVAAAAVAGFH
jgi:adenylate cyclase